MDGLSSVAIAAIGLASLLATGFFALVNKQIHTHDKIAEAMNKMASSNEHIAAEARKGNKEAKDRNGHLAELIIQSKDTTINAIQNIEEQHVDKQVVSSAIIDRRTDRTETSTE